jgi:membrane-associated phospholipid phosphatase
MRTGAQASPTFARPVAAITRGDLPKLGVMLVVTAATLPLDRPLARRFAEPWIADNRSYRELAKGLTRIHERSLFVGSLATYAVGRVAGWSRMADLGYHSAEAIAIGTAVGSILKPTVGRARPYAVNGDDAFEFKFGKGYTDGRYRAFPSLHEIGSFAAASVVTEEVGLWAPGAKPYVATAAYGLAGLVGIGRMYTEQHWASDVVLGSALGAFIGRRVVHYAHARSRSRMDRWFLGAAPASGGGARLSIGREF